MDKSLVACFWLDSRSTRLQRAYCQPARGSTRYVHVLHDLGISRWNWIWHTLMGHVRPRPRHWQARSDGGGYRYLYTLPPQKKTAQVNFYGVKWRQNGYSTVLYPQKNFYTPQNKFLATPLSATGAEGGGEERGGGFPLPSRLGDLGERRELPQRGPVRSPCRKRIFSIF